MRWPGQQVPTCDECGTQVKVDALAEWDVKAQEWVLATTYEAAYCWKCDYDDVAMSWTQAPKGTD
jgi:hypothetical protein